MNLREMAPDQGITALDLVRITLVIIAAWVVVMMAAPFWIISDVAEWRTKKKRRVDV